MTKFEFDLPTKKSSIIKVLGVGGGGSNAVNYMFRLGIRGVDFVVCNTDAQALEASPVSSKVQLGANLTSGLGAGTNPEKGKKAAIESRDQIRQLFSDGTRMVFITAGLGGGTGTGGAPEIAKIAREMDILTVGIVTLPFSYEGPRKIEKAKLGLEELKKNVDTILVVSNDKLREIHGNLKISMAFGKADDVLATAAKGLAEIITLPGHVNVDFEDVITVMKNAGTAVMGSARVDDVENRAIRAAELALSSPLLDNTDIYGAKYILLNITSGENEVTMDEVGEINEYIQEKVGRDGLVIWGNGKDTSLGDSINLTVIVTGFEHKLKSIEPKVVIDLESKMKKTIPDSGTLFSNNAQNNGTAFTQDKKEEDKKVVYDFETGAEIPAPPVNNEKKSYTPEPNLAPSAPSASSMNERPKVDHARMQEAAKERIERLKNLSVNVPNSNIKDMLNTPAFQRRNTVFENVPHSSEKGVSRYTLTEENELLGNNRFLHDNVD